MAAAADGRDLVLARTIGKRGLALLRQGGMRNERKRGGSDQRCGQRSGIFPPSDGLVAMGACFVPTPRTVKQKARITGL